MTETRDEDEYRLYLALRAKYEPTPVSLPAPVGRPEVEINLSLLRDWASMGHTQKEIAGKLGVSLSALKSRIRECPETEEAWREGRAGIEHFVRRKLVQHANGKGPAAVTATVHLANHILGENSKSVVEHANKDGKPLQVAVAEPDSFMGIKFDDAPPRILSMMEEIARWAAEKEEAERAAEALDVTEVVTEE